MSTSSLPPVQPMLAVSAEPFDSGHFLFEVKWDGYRCLAYLDRQVQLNSRNGLDMTEIFPEIAGLLPLEKAPCILDGEIIVLHNGLPSFNHLQKRGRLRDRLKIKHAAGKYPAIYMAFDLIYHNGESIMGMPLFARKEILRDNFRPGPNFLISEHVLEEGKKFARECLDKGLEGVMAKQLESPYLPGRRSTYWKKIRNTREADLVICGYQPGRGGRKLGSLLLGGYKGGVLVYQGKVGTGFSAGDEEQILDLLAQISASAAPANIPAPEARNARWVRPELVCKVNYLALTGDGLLRHPVFKGLRGDKRPEDCRAVEDQ